MSIECPAAVVICDSVTMRSKQYAFVTYRDPESAERALADTGMIINGRLVEVRFDSCAVVASRCPFTLVPPSRFL